MNATSDTQAGGISRRRIAGVEIPATLLVVLTILFIILNVFAQPGVFSIDEVNYLVTVAGLRQGMLDVPGTRGLTPGPELYAFDPEPHMRISATGEIVSLAPPLYAFVAFPFSYLGWRGLILLNVLSFVIVAFVLFVMARAVSGRDGVAWFVLFLWVAGGYSIEYAQAVWPHMLSVALCTTAIFLSFVTRTKRGLWPVFAAGVLIGIAAGVREQNIVLGFCLGLGLLIWAPRRIVVGAVFAAGVAIPLFVSASINYAKHDVWHPVPKAVTYSSRVTQEVELGRLQGTSPIQVFWTKVVDFTSHPEIDDEAKASMFRRDPASGALLVGSTMKKAWLQSSPWLILGFLATIGAWFTGRWFTGDARREVRILSVIILPTLAMFTVAGFGRIDGWAFNQRYFLELVPLMALAAGYLFTTTKIAARDVSVGSLAGVLGTVGGLAAGSLSDWYSVVALVPLVMAAGLLACWFFKAGWKWGRVLAALIGLAVGWSLALHLIDDVRASREKRWQNYERQIVLEDLIPPRSALIAYWGEKDAAGPLILDRDFVLLDAWADQGADAPLLARELYGQGRQVYILDERFPQEIVRQIQGTDSLEIVQEHPVRLLRLVLQSNAGALTGPGE